MILQIPAEPKHLSIMIQQSVASHHLVIAVPVNIINLCGKIRAETAGPAGAVTSLPQQFTGQPVSGHTGNLMRVIAIVNAAVRLLMLLPVTAGRGIFILTEKPDEILRVRIVKLLRTFRKRDISPFLPHYFHNTAQDIRRSIITVLPERFHRRLYDTPVQIRL